MSGLLDETRHSELSSSSSAITATDLDATPLSPLFDSRWRQIPGSFPSGRGYTPPNSATYSVAHPVTLTTPCPPGYCRPATRAGPGAPEAWR